MSKLKFPGFFTKEETEEAKYRVALKRGLRVAGMIIENDTATETLEDLYYQTYKRLPDDPSL